MDWVDLKKIKIITQLVYDQVLIGWGQIDLDPCASLAISKQHDNVSSLYGHGEIGKSFMQRTLAYALRSEHQIVLTIDYS